MKVRKYTSFHKDFIWNKSYLPSCMLAINFQMEIKIWGHRNSQILIKPTYKEIFRSGHPLWCGKYITGAHKKKKRKKRRLLIWKWNSMKNWEVYTVCCEITGKWRPNGFQVGTVFYEHFSDFQCWTLLAMNWNVILLPIFLRDWWKLGVV